MLQLRLECKAAQERAEAAEAELAQELSAHRRDLRRKNKDLAEAQVSLLHWMCSPADL